MTATPRRLLNSADVSLLMFSASQTFVQNLPPQTRPAGTGRRTHCLVSRVATRCGGQPTLDLSRSVYNFYRARCSSTNSERQRLKTDWGRHPEAQ